MHGVSHYVVEQTDLTVTKITRDTISIGFGCLANDLIQNQVLYNIDNQP